MELEEAGSHQNYRKARSRLLSDVRRYYRSLALAGAFGAARYAARARSDARRAARAVIELRPTRTCTPRRHTADAHARRCGAAAVDDSVELLERKGHCISEIVGATIDRPRSALMRIKEFTNNGKLAA